MIKKSDNADDPNRKLANLSQEDHLIDLGPKTIL